MHFWSKFSDSNWNGWKVIVRTISKWGKIRLSSWIWPLRSRSITPKNSRHLNQGVLHLWSKFGDSSLNGWWVIMRTSKWLIHTHRHMDTQTDTLTQAMTIPEGQNWPRMKMHLKVWSEKWQTFYLGLNALKDANAGLGNKCEPVMTSWCHIESWNFTYIQIMTWSWLSPNHFLN